MRRWKRPFPGKLSTSTANHFIMTQANTNQPPMPQPIDYSQPLNRTVLQAMPKIDLHRHLEGSLRLESLLAIAREFNLDLPMDGLEALRPLVQVTDDPPDHEVFLSKFQVLRQFYRNPELVKRLTYEVIADAAADNVHYLELRFSPQALTRVNEYTLHDAVHWVREAAQHASRDFAIEVGLIITLVRHDPLEQAEMVVDAAERHVGRGIAGIDLAGDEVAFPPGPFTPIFKRAHEAGLGITIHAGEWASADGVKQAIEDLYADRIGHGVRLVENSRIARMVRERGVALEVCLTSNVQTGVIHDIRHHPLADLLNFGLQVTINTDDPTVSNITLTDEYEIATTLLNQSYTDLRQMILNAAEAAFLPEESRKRLVTYFEDQLPRL